MPPPEFEAVIGLEVHCQLATRTKLFCPCPLLLPEAVSHPNQNVCEICLGYPGSLPRLNAEAIELAVRLGIALQGHIHLQSLFARKHYFYPDLPKGYQISQFDQPLCEQGRLEIQSPSRGAQTITIQRMHLEEDAGKNVHLRTHSAIDFNRAGIPLVEIVSAPDLRSALEAGAYLRTLHAIVTRLKVCRGSLQAGNLRCDANVSLRPVGTQAFGTRTEIKNLNSFRYVERAIDYEIARQTQLLRVGATVRQETRTFDEDRDCTVLLRIKDETQDYRYFSEPDLPPLRLEESWVEVIRTRMPALPQEIRARLITQYALSPYDAGVISASELLYDWLEEAVGQLSSQADQSIPKIASIIAHLLTGEVSRLLNLAPQAPLPTSGQEASRLQATHLRDLALEIASETLSSTAAKTVLAEAWKSGDSIDALVTRLGLRQVNDISELRLLIQELEQDFPVQMAEWKAGKTKLRGFLVGQAMKKTAGKINPEKMGEILERWASTSD